MRRALGDPKTLLIGRGVLRTGRLQGDECWDWFDEAYYGRLEAFLDEKARLARSSWSLAPEAVVRRFVVDP